MLSNVVMYYHRMQCIWKIESIRNYSTYCWSASHTVDGVNGIDNVFLISCIDEYFPLTCWCIRRTSCYRKKLDLPVCTEPVLSNEFFINCMHPKYPISFFTETNSWDSRGIFTENVLLIASDSDNDLIQVLHGLYSCATFRLSTSPTLKWAAVGFHVL